MTAFIKVDNLSFAYDGNLANRVLHELDLEIHRGEFVSIIGANGSGKSTLAKHFNCLLLPTAGQVLIEGADTRSQEKVWNIRKKIGMVFQNPDNQIVASIVEEDVAFGLENLGVPAGEIRERVDWALELVGMSDYRKRGTQFLSGGQKQRVSIAGVMAMQPTCLVLDEPTAMLDPQGREEVMETVKALNREQKVTVVLITHHMEEALLADRVVIMNKGCIVQAAPPERVFQNKNLIEEAGLEMPVLLELATRLRQEGIRLPDRILTLDEMVNALCG